MVERFFIPSHGPDFISLRHGLEWLLSQNNSLILYVSILDHLREGKMLSGILGNDVCKKLVKEKTAQYKNKKISVITKSKLRFTREIDPPIIPSNSSILSVHSSSDNLNKIEHYLEFKKILVVPWATYQDLFDWINNHHVEQYDNFLPIDPRNLPGYEKSIHEKFRFQYQNIPYEDYQKL